jgi:PAS domain S-box-containing protein
MAAITSSRPRESAAARRELWRGAARLALLFVLAATLVFLSHQFSREAGRVAAIWPLNAAVLAVLMRQPAAAWPGFLASAALANLAVNAAMGDPFWVSLLLTCANVIEIAICAHLLKRPGAPFDITRTPDLLRFIAVAGVLAPAASSGIAALTLAPSQPPLETWTAWFAADALGMLVFGPACLVLGAQMAQWTQVRPHLFEATFSASVLAVALGVVFWQTSYPLLFLIPPALTLATFRLGIAGAAGGIVLTSLVAIGFTVAGYGPMQLIAGSDTERAITLQVFLAVMSLTTLPVAAAIAQWQRAQADLASTRAKALESEAHYRTLADYSTDIVLRFGKGGIISYVSPAVRLLGLTPEDVTGRPVSDFVAPYDRAFSASLLDALFAGPEPDRSIRREFRVAHPDGSSTWLEGNPNIIRNDAGAPVEVVSTFRDVTARKELEHELLAARQRAEMSAQAAQESETRYRTMADISLDMIARIDLDATIRFVSPSCKVVLGYTPEELIGTKTSSHMHPDDVPGVIAFFDRLTAAGPSAPPLAYRYRARRADGVYIWLEGIPRILYDSDGAPLEVQDSARDVTQRTELENELLEARATAESAARAKADFLANMSHELRTPLHSIVGFSRLLSQSTALSPTDSRHVDLIATSSQGLLAIVNDILDFSALEGAGVRLETAPMSVATLVRRCLDGLRVQADAKNLDLACALDPEVASAHVGDKARLNQILINLVGNAIKFTAAGHVIVRVAAMLPEAGRQKLRFQVSDTGIGIAADRIDDLFVRFSQLDTSISRRFGGTGLGLAISKHLVDLMGGEIGVTSEEGVGSTFWFSVDLPIGEVALLSPDAGYAATPMELSRRILVVDDVELNRELAVAMLAGSVHDIDVAANGAAAIEMVRVQKYDLVFMDVQMPGIDGLAATRAIRAIAGCKDLPIVAMTAQALPAQIAACRAAGMNDHLAKPISPESLQAMIGRWTTARGAQATPAPRTLMEDLQARFVDRSRQDRSRLAELLATAAPSDLGELRALVHRFAGTAGTFGFADIGDCAAALDRRFAAGEGAAPEDFTPLLQALDDLLEAA